MTKSERQAICIDNWLKNKGNGIVVAAPGFGKTRVACDIIRKMIVKNPDIKVIVTVPIDALLQQWKLELAAIEGLKNYVVSTFHVAYKNHKNESFDLMIVDEIHRSLTKSFEKQYNIKRRFFLGLTGTLERADNRHLDLIKHIPVVDTISVREALDNKWISQYKQYRILIDTDITEYLDYEEKFRSHFAHFNNDFSFYQNVLTSKNPIVKKLKNHAHSVSTYLSLKNTWVYNHPIKAKIVNNILNQFDKEKKIMCFSQSHEFNQSLETTHNLTCVKYDKKTNTTSLANKPKKQVKSILEQFSRSSHGSLGAVKALDIGVDIEGVNAIIVASNYSSSEQYTQRVSRGIRFKEGKEAIIIRLVLKGTVEEKWFDNSIESIDKYEDIEVSDIKEIINGYLLKTKKTITIE